MPRTSRAPHICRVFRPGIEGALPPRLPARRDGPVPTRGVLYMALVLCVGLVSVLPLPVSAPTPAFAVRSGHGRDDASSEQGGDPTDAYRTSLVLWGAGPATAGAGFDRWTRAGTVLAPDGALQLDPRTAQPGTDPYPPGGYFGGSFYNGGGFLVGTATGPPVASAFGFREAIASWNADTPAGTWIEVQLRVRIGSRWSRWYSMGVWASDDSTVRRHSASRQADADARVEVDTLVLAAHRPAARALQLRLRLFTSAPSRARGTPPSPAVRLAAVAISTTPRKPVKPAPGDPRLWGRVLDVRPCSQMVYPEGGEVWCSPTSTSMVLAYWQKDRDRGGCAPGVYAAVSGVADWFYGGQGEGHGNWPFNTAYAASMGGGSLTAYVARFTGLAQAERWIAAGVPVVMSYGWKRGELEGAPLPASNGHLVVLVGFDAAGNPVINDPAAPTDAGVRRTYPRSQVESLWLEHSGGTVYLIYPKGLRVPGF